MTDELMITPTQNVVASRHKNSVVKELGLLLTNAGMQAIPVVGSSIAALIFGSISLAKERRAQMYLDELEQKLHEIGEDTVAREEFTHLFTVTARAALNTQQDEKIRRFAQLFASFANGNNLDRVDEFEEAAQLLTELSEREFQVLLILDLHERTAPIDAPANMRRTINLNGLFWIPFLDMVEQKAGIPFSEILGVLERLRRTGLYQTWPNSQGGGFLNKGVLIDEHDLGHLTPNFDALMRLLREETISVEDSHNGVTQLMETAQNVDNIYFRISSNFTEEEAEAILQRIDEETGFIFTGWIKKSPDMHAGSPRDPYRYTVRPTLAQSAQLIVKRLSEFPEIDVVSFVSAHLH